MRRASGESNYGTFYSGAIGDLHVKNYSILWELNWIHFHSLKLRRKSIRNCLTAILFDWLEVVHSKGEYRLRTKYTRTSADYVSFNHTRTAISTFCYVFLLTKLLILFSKPLCAHWSCRQHQWFQLKENDIQRIAARTELSSWQDCALFLIISSADYELLLLLLVAVPFSHITIRTFSFRCIRCLFKSFWHRNVIWVCLDRSTIPENFEDAMEKNKYICE